MSVSKMGCARHSAFVEAKLILEQFKNINLSEDSSDENVEIKIFHKLDTKIPRAAKVGWVKLSCGSFIEGLDAYLFEFKTYS
jgi:hypothetical protein